MSVTITWRPNPVADEIVSYTLNKATASTGPWTLVYSVPATQSGPYWNATYGVYTYTDLSGDLTTWYQLIAVNALAEDSAPSAPFQAISPTPAIPSTVAVNQDYPTPNNLRYQDANGNPIEGAVIRIFLQVDYNIQNFSNPQAVTVTKADGNWYDTVFLTTGFTYTVQFFKDGLYGPDHVDIIC